MPDISKHPVLRQIYELCQAIELCGASPELTNAVTLAVGLYEPVGALIDGANEISGDGSGAALPPVGDSEIERSIQTVGAGVAPRVTPDQIDQLHGSLTVLLHRFSNSTLTVAVATLPDGFVVGTGYSKPISATNFNAEIGAKIATTNALNAARDKLWELEGYALRCRLLSA